MAALSSTVEGETNSGPSSILLIPAITACRDEIFSKSTVAHTKMAHVSKTTPLLGTVCRPSAGTSVTGESRSFAMSTAGPAAAAAVRQLVHTSGDQSLIVPARGVAAEFK